MEIAHGRFGRRGARGAFVSLIMLGLGAPGHILRALRLFLGSLSQAGLCPGHSPSFEFDVFSVFIQHGSLSFAVRLPQKNGAHVKLFTEGCIQIKPTFYSTGVSRVGLF